MCWVMVDVEADGPVPADFSMIALGAVIIEPSLSKKFYARLKPVSCKWNPDALKICGFTREETLGFDDPGDVMNRFERWLHEKGGENLFFLSDNNGFDWQFVNWYFYHFTGRNPFGFSSSNLLSLYLGLEHNMYCNFNHLRKKPHDHNPLHDALADAEVLLELRERFCLKMNF